MTALVSFSFSRKTHFPTDVFEDTARREDEAMCPQAKKSRYSIETIRECQLTKASLYFSFVTNSCDLNDRCHQISEADFTVLSTLHAKTQAAEPQVLAKNDDSRQEHLTQSIYSAARLCTNLRAEIASLFSMQIRAKCK